MFFIFGFGNRKGGEFQAYDNFGRGYAVFYIANTFSLFFIPIINFSKRYFISINGEEKEISKEEYLEMKKTGKVLSQFENFYANEKTYENSGSQSENKSYTGGICPVCKKELTPDFAYCPYCGQKRPKA